MRVIHLRRLSATAFFLISLGAAAAVSLLAPMTAAHAAGWKPERRVEIVLGVGPGGNGQNQLARFLRETWVRDGVIPPSSIVLNKPGGGHAVALSYTAGRPPGTADTIQIVNTPMITNNLLGRSPITFRDFTPLALLYDEDVVFTVAADSPLRSGRDLVARLQKDPQSVVLSVATGVGTVQYIAAAMVAKAAGVDLGKTKLKAVSFASGSEAITATLGGRIDVMISTAPEVLPFVEAKKMRVIAIASEVRQRGLLADAPTWKEQGVDAVIPAWRGVIGPKGMTHEQLEFWDHTIGNVVASKAWADQIGKIALTFRYLNAAKAKVFFAAEEARYRAIYKELGTE